MSIKNVLSLFVNTLSESAVFASQFTETQRNSAKVWVTGLLLDIAPKIYGQLDVSTDELEFNLAEYVVTNVGNKGTIIKPVANLPGNVPMAKLVLNDNYHKDYLCVGDTIWIKPDKLSTLFGNHYNYTTNRWKLNSGARPKISSWNSVIIDVIDYAIADTCNLNPEDNDDDKDITPTLLLRYISLIISRALTNNFGLVKSIVDLKDVTKSNLSSTVKDIVEEQQLSGYFESLHSSDTYSGKYHIAGASKIINVNGRVFRNTESFVLGGINKSNYFVLLSLLRIIGTCCLQHVKLRTDLSDEDSSTLIDTFEKLADSLELLWNVNGWGTQYEQPNTGKAPILVIPEFEGKQESGSTITKLSSVWRPRNQWNIDPPNAVELESNLDMLEQVKEHCKNVPGFSVGYLRKRRLVYYSDGIFRLTKHSINGQHTFDDNGNQIGTDIGAGKNTVVFYQNKKTKEIVFGYGKSRIKSDWGSINPTNDFDLYSQYGDNAGDEFVRYQDLRSYLAKPAIFAGEAWCLYFTMFDVDVLTGCHVYFGTPEQMTNAYQSIRPDLLKAGHWADLMMITSDWCSRNNPNQTYHEGIDLYTPFGNRQSLVSWIMSFCINKTIHEVKRADPSVINVNGFNKKGTYARLQELNDAVLVTQE